MIACLLALYVAWLPSNAARESRATAPASIFTARGLAATKAVRTCGPRLRRHEPAPPDFFSLPQHGSTRPIAAESEASEAAQPAAAGSGSAPAPAEVRVAAISVRGSLAVSVVRRAIERTRPLLTLCYRTHLTPGDGTHPVLRVTAIINEGGRVRSPSVQGGMLTALNECVIRATSKMVSEAPDTGTVRASWELSFTL